MLYNFHRNPFQTQKMKISTASFIFGIYFRKHWTYSFNFIVVLIIYVGYYLSSLGAATTFEFQRISNNAFFAAGLTALIVSNFGLVLRIFFDMKNNVMYKRIGLTGVNGLGLIWSYIIWSLIITVASFVCLLLFAFFCLFLMLNRSNSSVSPSKILTVVFNNDFFVNLDFLIMAFAVLLGVGLLLNATLFSTSVANMLYPMTNILLQFIFIFINLIPSILGHYGYFFGWAANSFDFNDAHSHLGISNFSIGGTIGFFLAWNVLGISVLATSYYLANKYFKWSK